MTQYSLAFVRWAGCVLTALTGLVATDAVWGATSTFVQGSTAWNNSASWADGGPPAPDTPPTTGGGHIPNVAGDVAILQQRVTSNGSLGAAGTHSINLNGTITIGTLTVNNTTNEYNTAIAGTMLVFDNSGSDAVFSENLGIGVSNTSRTRITAPITLNSNLIVNQNHNLLRNTATEFTQQIIAAADKTLTKRGEGNLQLAYGGSADGFLGDVVIENGAIRLINGSGASNTVFSKARGILVADGAQLQFGNGITSIVLGDSSPGVKAELKLNGIGNDNPNPSFGFPEGALRFEGTAGNTIACTFNNPVRLQTTSRVFVTALDATGILTEEVRGDGNAGLNKGGLGLLKLTTPSVNGNTYSGTTNVTKGALAVNNTVATTSGVGTGNVVINDTGSGAALGGTGYIGTTSNASNVTLTGGGLYPGDLTATTVDISPVGLITTPGQLTIHGDLTFDSLASLNLDVTSANVGTGYDQLVCDGAISLGGATLNFSLGAFVPAGTETFTLINNTGASAVVGEFGNYTQGAAVDLAGQTFFIDYAGGTGNDVVLSSSAPSLEDADFDGDGDVDGADFLTWQRGVGTAGGQPEGNADGVGGIDGADLDVWKNQFGTATVAAGAVPEPTSAVLLLLSASGAALIYRRAART